MKELSIEQKAKAYDEAFERARLILQERGNEPDGASILSELFPELKESEDEKIRKDLIVYLRSILSNKKYGDKFIEGWIAWLEKQGEHANFRNKIQIGDKVTRNKDGVLVNLSQLNRVAKKQGEQKPTDKVEPKFKVGDWVIDKQGLVHQIANVIENVTYHTYGYDIVGGGYFNDNTEGVRLWTIQDAKDGDILSYDNGKWIFIVKNIEDISVNYYVLLYDKKELTFNCGGETTLIETIAPATKEQRDALMKAMANAGYTFDFDKKELKKIEQNHTWSEENERMINTVISDLERHGGKEGSCYSEEINFLKSLKDRVQPQPKQEWSTCDEFTIKILNTVCDEYLKISTYKGTEFRHEIIDSQKWLKSLKDRYTWKPSDEQMLAINTAINVVGKGTINGKYLVELQEQLKKLREE